MRYVTLDYINEYLADEIYVYSTWEVLDDTVKTKYINMVEKIIDNTELMNVGWIGERFEQNQVSAFPRKMYEAIQSYPGFYTVNEFVIDRIQKEEGLIPESIRKAIAETIKYMLNDKFKVMRDMQDSNITDFSAGSSSFTFGDDSWKLPLPRNAWYLISYLTKRYWNDSGTERLVRK